MGEKVVKISERNPSRFSTQTILEIQVVSRLVCTLRFCGPIGGMCLRVRLKARDATVGLGLPHSTHDECLSFRMGVP
jgi:hypothetical protein